MTRPQVTLVVVVALLGIGVAVGQGLPPAGARAPEPSQVAVVGASAVCPDVRQDPGAGLSTTVAVGVATAPEPRADPSDDPGEVTRTVLAAEPVAPAVLPLPAPGTAVADLATSVVGAYAVRARGPLAAGLTVQQTSRGAAGAERGLSTLACPPARTDTWLVGGSATVGETAELVLVNPDEQDAVVDVTVLSAEGPVDERSGSGVSVPAGSRMVVPLEELAPDRSRLAVRVHAVRGRVATALRHTRFDGLVPHGVEHAAALDRPADELVLPGLPAGPGRRSVWLANPGEVDVQVEVEVTTADGQFVPDGLSAVVVPAGSTVDVDVTDPLAASPAAVRLTADGPVLAAGLAEDAGAGDVRDLAYARPAGALAGPALLPDVVLDGVTEHTLLLSALTGDAVVDVVVLPVHGHPPVPAPPRRVEVPGGRTVAVRVADLVPAEARGRVAVEVRPDAVGSPVHAGVRVAVRPPDGPLTTGYALSGAPRLLPRPVVVRDPGAGAGSQ